MTTIKGSKGVDVDAKTAALARALVDRVGLIEAARTLGMHKGTVSRLCARLAVQKMTLDLARMRLAAPPAETTTKEQATT
jgi:hypothetical protein